MVADATAAAHNARIKAGEVTHQNRARIDSLIGKAADAVNRQTGGRYSSTVNRVTAAVRKGVDQMEAQRLATPPAATGAPAAGTPGSPAQPTAAPSGTHPGAASTVPGTPVPAHTHIAGSPGLARSDLFGPSTGGPHPTDPESVGNGCDTYRTSCTSQARLASGRQRRVG